MSLYTMNLDIVHILMNEVDENGEITEEAAKKLAELELGRQEKIEALCVIEKNLRSESAAIKEEKKALEDRMKAKDRKADWIDGYLKQCMNPEEKFECARAAIKWTKGESVEVDEAKILKKYWRVKKEVDKAAIKADLKAGLKVRGAALVKTLGLKIK